MQTDRLKCFEYKVSESDPSFLLFETVLSLSPPVEKFAIKVCLSSMDPAKISQVRNTFNLDCSGLSNEDDYAVMNPIFGISISKDEYTIGSTL